MLRNEEILAGEDATQAILRESSESPSEHSPLLGNLSDDGAAGKVPQEWEGVSWWRRPSVYWLLLPFMLFTTAFGGIGVPKLNIILELICREYYTDRKLLDGDMLYTARDNQCRIPEIQALVSRFTLYIQLIAGVLSAITAPILGAYSDRHGRRLVLLISSIGLLASEITSILAAKYPNIFSVNFLLVGSVIDGVTGSFMVGMAVAHSYAADCTSVAKRAVSFGYIQGSLYLGIAVGPALGGILIKATGNPLNVFYAAMIAHGFFMFYIIAILPESLTPARMHLAQEKYNHQQALREEALRDEPRSYLQRLRSWNPLQPLSILYPTGPGSSPRLRTNLIVLAACDTLFFGVGMGGMTVIIMYAEMVFEWGNYESSMFISLVNSARVIMLFAIMPLVVKAVTAMVRRRTINTPFRERDSQEEKHSGAGTLDIALIRFAIFIELLGHLGYATAMNGAEFTLGGLLTALGGVGSPIAQSALTKHIPRDKTGQLLGASALLRSLARVFFPTLFNLIYAGTVGTFPQTVFVCLASVFLLSAGCSYFITPHIKLHEDKHGNLVDGEHQSSSSVPSSVSPA